MKAKKDYKQAQDDFTAALKLDAKYAPAINNTAWLLAACPDEKIRDGKKAVELATKLVEGAGKKNGSACETMAAAFAETEKFDEAVEWQERALEDAAHVEAHGEAARKRLELYKDKKAFRE